MTGQEALKLEENLKTFQRNEREIEHLKGFEIDLREVNAKRKDHKRSERCGDEPDNTYYDIVRLKLTSTHSRYEDFSTSSPLVVKAVIKDIGQKINDLETQNRLL